MKASDKYKRLYTLLALFLILSLFLPLASKPVRAEAKADETLLINPLENPSKDPLGDRKPFFDQKEEIDPEFFEAGLAYYKEIAGYSKNDQDMNHYIKKWISPLRIGLEDRSLDDNLGKPLESLNDFVKQLNSLELLPEISLTPIKEGPNNVHLLISNKRFLSVKEFPGLKENSAFYINWTSEPPYRLYSAKIGVAYDQVETDEVARLAKQALLQSLGFMTLSETHSDSIFKANDLTNDYLSELDWLVLEMHYRPELKPGMDFDRAVEILENLYLGEADYNPEEEEPSPAEIQLEKWKQEEFDQVQKDQELWQSFGISLNPDGHRERFLDRKEEIDPEFFELGLKYYEEVAGYGEFDSSYDGFIKKWGDPIHIYLEYEDDPNEKVLEAFENLISQINSLDLVPEITYSYSSEDKYNMHVVFTEIDNLTYRFPGAPPGNWGFFLYWWKGNPLYEIDRAQVGVATDVNTEVHMIHLMTEEIVQALGLINDSEIYRDSMFCQTWGHIQHMSEIDWLLLEMHYRPEIEAGMAMEDALEILRDLYLGK